MNLAEISPGPCDWHSGPVPTSALFKRKPLNAEQGMPGVEVCGLDLTSAFNVPCSTFNIQKIKTADPVINFRRLFLPSLPFYPLQIMVTIRTPGMDCYVAVVPFPIFLNS
jgi:hypothetical protein